MQSRNQREGWYFGKMKLPSDIADFFGLRADPKPRHVRTKSKFAGVRYGRHKS